jgi:hypothetical protein
VAKNGKNGTTRVTKTETTEEKPDNKQTTRISTRAGKRDVTTLC